MNIKYLFNSTYIHIRKFTYDSPAAEYTYVYIHIIIIKKE